jgi:hypothetical protein
VADFKRARRATKADALKRLQAETAAELDALPRAILQYSLGFDTPGDSGFEVQL